MKIAVLLALFCVGLISCDQSKNTTVKEFYLYVGAYTQGEDEGISLYEFNSEDGSINYLATTEGVENPSYLVINPEQNLLLAVNETVDYKGMESGAVSAFKIDRSNGQLKFVNQVPSEGGAPCYVSLTHDASLALVANYVGGNVAAFPVGDGREIQKATSIIQHKSAGPDSSRQERSHAHAIVMDPNEKYALAVDLGIDKVITYEVDKQNGALNKVSEFNSKSGAGPRHLVFSNDGNFVFIINELNSTITSCSYNAESGSLEEITTESTLPGDYNGDNSCADIQVSNDGRFLYGSNRGHDSIVVFEIDPSGGLSYQSHHSVEGKTPRNFMIDPTGSYLLVANQNSDNIVVFSIDQRDGSLHKTGYEVKTSRPVCLKMMPKS